MKWTSECPEDGTYCWIKSGNFDIQLVKVVHPNHRCPKRLEYFAYDGDWEPEEGTLFFPISIPQPPEPETP